MDYTENIKRQLIEKENRIKELEAQLALRETRTCRKAVQAEQERILGIVDDVEKRVKGCSPMGSDWRDHVLYEIGFIRKQIKDGE